jgi:hypothetical protein
MIRQIGQFSTKNYCHKKETLRRDTFGCYTGQLIDVAAALACQRQLHCATCLRLVSIFRRGWIVILVTC